MSEEKLLPCPLPCPFHKPGACELAVFRNTDRERWVEASCGVRGPSGETPAEAVAAWNKRTPSARGAGEALEAALQEFEDRRYDGWWRLREGPIAEARERLRSAAPSARATPALDEVLARIIEAVDNYSPDLADPDYFDEAEGKAMARALIAGRDALRAQTGQVDG